MRPVNRINRDLLPSRAYQTYSISQTPDTFVPAACEQVGCEQWTHGWDTPVDETTELGRRQAAWIRARSGRTFRELRTAAGLTVFRFDSGQRCFREHQTRPQLFVVADGDHRGNPTGRVRRHTHGADWVEDMAENLDKFQTDQQRG